MRSLSAIFVAVALVAAPVRAGEDDARDIAQRQEGIRQRTAALAAQLEGIIADYEQSGLMADPEVAVLRQARGALAELSADEMAAVVASLKAGKTGDARSGQAEVISRLKQVLAEYQKHRDAEALARRAHELMQRQQAAMQATIAAAKTAGARPWDPANPAQRQVVAGLAAQQRAIAADVAELQPVPEVLAGELHEQLQAAASDLDGGEIFRAAAHQRQARDLLRKLERAVSPPRDRKQQLQDAAGELAAEIATQQSLLEQARATRDNGQLPRFEAAEGELAEAVDATRGDLWELLQPAANDVAQAVKAIQAARTKLQHRIPAGAGDQQNAVDLLTSARQKVLQELGNQPAISAENQAKLEKIERAEKALDKVIEQQAKASQKAADARQAAGEKQAAEEREAAAEQAKAREAEQGQHDELQKASPDAARSSDKAKEAMEHAEEKLKKGDGKSAEEDQGQAEKKLADARQKLQAESDKIKGQEGDAKAAGREAAKQAAAAAGEAEKKLNDGGTPTESQAEPLAKSAAEMAKAQAQSGEEAIAEAKEALRQAAAAARAGNRDAAKEALGKAKEALKSASEPPDAPAPESSNGARTADGKRTSRDTGSKSPGAGPTAAIALPPRDRAALEQSPPETYPAEYRALIDAYLRSLTGSGGR